MSRKKRKPVKASQPERDSRPPSTAAGRSVPASHGGGGAGRMVLSTHPHNLYLILYLSNVIFALLWPMVISIFGFLDYVIGFFIGMALIAAFHRPYAWRAYRMAYFVGYVVWQIILSNFSIAKLVLQPNPKLDPGIIAIPLTVSTGLEIMILASVITLTPGTLSVDLGQNASGRQVLYVHNLRVGDPEAFRRSIQDGFERLLLQVTRGATV